MTTKIDFSKLTLMDAIDLAALIEIEASQALHAVRATARKQ